VRAQRELAALALLLVQSIGVAQELPANQAFPEPAPLTQLEQADQMLTNLKQGVWRMSESTASSPPDPQGHRLADDLTEFVLTEPFLKQYAEARAKAEEQLGSQPQANAIPVLQPLQELLLTETLRMSRVAMYWTFERARQYHHDRVATLLHAAPEAQRKPLQLEMDRIDTEAQDFRAQMRQLQLPQPFTVAAGVEASARWGEQLAALVRAYNALRQRLLSQVPYAERGALNTSSRERTDPCPTAPQSLPSRSRLSILSSPDVSDHYPDLMQRYQVVGLVRVRVRVSPSHCVERVQVAETSGSPELDDAALTIALLSQFAAPTRDGKTQEAESILPIRFSLQD
jgi:TonB family protein